MSAPLRTILFDLGDTVIQYGQIDRAALFHRAAWRTYRMWARRQRRLSPERVRMPDFRRYYLHQWFAMRWGYLKLLLRRREMDAMRVIRRASRKLWLNAPDEFFNELAWNWYQPLAQVARLEPGTLRTLRALRERGLSLGLVSNTFVPGQVLDRHLGELQLLDLFPVRVYSCDVGFRKPDRRIFELALNQLEADPRETLFVGDSLRADVGGARRLGMHVAWKRPRHQRHLAPPLGVPVLDRFRDLTALIERLASPSCAAPLPSPVILAHAPAAARLNRPTRLAPPAAAPAPTTRSAPRRSSANTPSFPPVPRPLRSR
jgi:putative hydrolase of the HAD superfamily